MNLRIIVLYICLSTLVLSCKSGPPKRPIVWKETIGYFDPRRYKGGKITYNTDVGQYTVSYNYMTDICYGLKYSMRYNINDPEEIEIDYWNPIFEKGEETYSTVATITGFQPETFFSGKGDVVNYYYTVNGRKLKKWAYLHPKHNSLFPGLDVKQCYKVEYWSENANRHKIHLDEPLKCDEVITE